LLEDEVAKGNLPGLKEKLAYYDKTEPGMRDNELHSILGTEYANLSPELEKYYSQYFVDRKRVVAANEQIMKPLNDLMDSMNSLQSQADALKKTSDAYLAQHVSAANSGNVSAANHYYDLYTQEFNKYSAKETEYNAIVVRYNALADQYNGRK
jgi:hypothetical protein